MWILKLIVVLSLFNGLESYDLNCIPNNDDLKIRDNDYIGVTGHKYDVYSQGVASIRLIKGLRKKSKSYYEGVLNNAIMALCDVEVEKARCVPTNSSMAAKDMNGNCLEPADFNCPPGYCETTSTCFWNPVTVGQVRSMRFPEEAYAEAEEELFGFGSKSYVRGLATFSIFGISIALLSLVAWLAFFIGRYCCCCLWTSCKVCYFCAPIPRDEGYNVFLQWIVPSLLYFIGFVIIIVCAMLALIGNADLSASATATFSFLSNLMEDLGTFLLKSSVPLKALSSIVNDAAADALTIFRDTSYVRSSADTIVSTFTDFVQLHISGLAIAGSAEEFGDAQSNFATKVSPTVDEIQVMLDTLENDLYNNVDTIQTSLDSAISQISSFQESTFLWQNDVHGYESIELEYRPYRLMSILGVFLASTVISGLGFSGIIAASLSSNGCCQKMQNLMDISSILSALIGSIIFVVASGTMLITFTWYDVCEISDIITSDFEPLVGETIAKGANAVFNDVNLADAFNFTDKIDFEERLGEGLDVLENANITQSFQMVVGPLEDIQDTAGNITTKALTYFNSLTSLSTPLDIACGFNDKYTKENMLQPWEDNKSKQRTTWKIFQTGDFGDYNRQGLENATEYFERIYNVAGACNENTTSCCIGSNCSLNQNDSCNKGENCMFSSVCKLMSKAINAEGFPAYLNAFDKEMKLSADLGVICPSKLSDSTPLTCPTRTFMELTDNNNDTLIGLVEDYRSNLTETATDLVDIATNSVGEAMTEIKKFLCNMNLSFIAGRYHQVKGQVCGKMLGGFAQINFSLWLLAILLEINAVLACMLSTRLRGVSKREAQEMESDIDNMRKSIRSSMRSTLSKGRVGAHGSMRSSMISNSSTSSGRRTIRPSSTRSREDHEENYV